MKEAVNLLLISMISGFIFAPFIINLLYKFKIQRDLGSDFSAVIEERKVKHGTPIMGGLIIISAVLVVTVLFNWNGNTYIPIAVMLISAALGGIDDVLNIFGSKRIIRTVAKQRKLAQVHKDPWQRLKYKITLPWTAYQNLWFALGSYPGAGIHAGEKVIIQLITGVLVAWWIYIRLGRDSVWFPILGHIDLGYLMPVFIIFTVISMENAVNISDGMDGLSAGLTLSSLGGFLIIALTGGNNMLAGLIATMIGALLAYLYFNIKPARVEMGDVGTLAMGAMLASISFALDTPILLLFISFPFVVIIGSSLLQSIYRKVFARRLLKMAPIHLHFQIVGWSEEKVVMRAWLMGILCTIVGVWVYIVFY